MLQYKSANPAEFESPIPSATWNSELFHFSDRILAIPELRLGSSFKPTTLIVFSLISIPEKGKAKKISEGIRSAQSTDCNFSSIYNEKFRRKIKFANDNNK